MDSLKIQTGAIRLAINEDPERVIEFNPNDILFAERFYGLIKAFEEKQTEYEKRAEALDNQEVDGFGIPANVGASLALLREACEYLRGQIDHLFGAGTSQIVFGEALELDAFEQFFTGITPFIQKARAGKVARYTGRKPGKKSRKVMR